MHPNNTGNTRPKAPFSSGRYTRFKRRVNTPYRGHFSPIKTNSSISFNSGNNNATKNKPKNKNGTKIKTIKNHTYNLNLPFRKEKMEKNHNRTKIPPSQ